MCNRYLVIYHASCADGFCCAWLMHRQLRQSSSDVEFLPAQYGDSPPSESSLNGRTVYILDFSYPRSELLAMNEAADSLLVLDHHKSAEDNLAGLEFCHFDMNKSGARLTWDWLIEQGPTPEPWLLRYTEDRDLWRWALPDSREINAALRSYPMTFAHWDELAQRHHPALIGEGAAILRSQRQTIESHVNQAFTMEIDGVVVPVVNATTLVSEIANQLAKGQPYAAVYFDTDDARVYSLRSDEKGLDVSAVAKRHGGGGHKHAAGFRIPLPEATLEMM